MLELGEQFPLVDDRSDRLLINYFDLGELLHGIKRLEFLAFYLPYLNLLISVPRNYVPFQSRPFRVLSGI